MDDDGSEEGLGGAADDGRGGGGGGGGGLVDVALKPAAVSFDALNLLSLRAARA